MCTAITYKTKHHYFGRNLDLEVSYGEKVTIMFETVSENAEEIEK